MTEAMIASLLEKTLIGGAFIYMLHYFLGKFSNTMDDISKNMSDMSNTLLKINSRLDSMEQRIEHLEGGR